MQSTVREIALPWTVLPFPRACFQPLWLSEHRKRITLCQYHLRPSKKNKKMFFPLFFVSPGHLGTIQNLIPGWTTIVKLLKQVKNWQSPSRDPWSNCLINSREDDKSQSYYYSGRPKDNSKTICRCVGVHILSRIWCLQIPSQQLSRYNKLGVYRKRWLHHTFVEQAVYRPNTPYPGVFSTSFACTMKDVVWSSQSLWSLFMGFTAVKEYRLSFPCLNFVLPPSILNLWSVNWLHIQYDKCTRRDCSELTHCPEV